MIATMANRHRSPLHIKLRGAFTLCEAYTVGTVCTQYDEMMVVQAAFICAGITAGLVAFTFQTRVDFTPLASTCYTLLWVLIITGFMQAFFPFSSQAQLLTASGGAALFSLFIVVDTLALDNTFREHASHKLSYAKVKIIRKRARIVHGCDMIG